MANQTGANILVAFKEEVTFNVAPSAAGAKRFRLNAGGGLALARATIAPNEIRSDLTSSMARLGSKSVGGSYPADLSVGTFDDLIQAALRGTFAAVLTITEATAGLTSITTTTSTIVAAAGSWITAGVKVGDVGRLTNHATGANNNKNLRVVGVSALTLTLAGTPLVADAAPDAAWILTIPKKVFQPTSPVRRSFTFEEYYTDIDLTAQFTGCRISSMKVTGAPDGMALIEFGIVGADLVPLATGTSPFFTTPTLTSTIALTWVDASLRFGGAEVTNLTAFEFTLDNRHATLPVIGSSVTPDVFDNSATLAGSLSGTRQDFTNLNRFIGETELEFHALLVEPESEPKDFIAFGIPRLKLTGADKALGGDSAMIETMPFMAGNKEVTTGYDATMLTAQTSAA